MLWYKVEVVKLDTYPILDISPRLEANLAVFPGDTPFSQQFLMDIERGDNLTLSMMSTTVHAGAHADAPRHYSKQGVGIEQRSLDLYLGAAQVITIPTRRGERISLDDLKDCKLLAPRVLFKTTSFPDPNQWTNDFMALSAEVIEYLADEGVRLVGIDTPSVDLADDKALESHQVLARRDMAVLEGIVLTEVSDGLYTLIALPLPITGADASPVRAVLLPRESLK
jgi:arylformamidase